MTHLRSLVPVLALAVVLWPRLGRAVEPPSRPPAAYASYGPPPPAAPYAAPPAPFGQPVSPAPMVTVDNWPGMARTGMGLTIAGLATGAVAGAIFGASLASESSSESSLAPLGVALGAVLFVPAGGLTLTGIPLWIAGEWDVEVPASDPRASRSRAALHLTPLPGGGGLVGRF